MIANREQRGIGDDSSTSFWTDSWISCGIISTTFPCLFRLALHLDDTVGDVTWDLLLRLNLNDMEISKWTTLSYHLNYINLNILINYINLILNIKILNKIN